MRRDTIGWQMLLQRGAPVEAWGQLTPAQQAHVHASIKTSLDSTAAGGAGAGGEAGKAAGGDGGGGEVGEFVAWAAKHPGQLWNNNKARGPFLWVQGGPSFTTPCLSTRAEL